MANQYRNEGMTESLFVRMTPTERKMVETLAEIDERSASDVVRRLIRQEAQRRVAEKEKKITA